MWLFTTIGFFSIVQKRGTKFLTVRARVASDLDRLRKEYMPQLSPTIIGGGTDYQFRATIKHQDFSEGLSKLVLTITYDNFKTEVARSMGKTREAAYHKVWHALFDLKQDEED